MPRLIDQIEWKVPVAAQEIVKEAVAKRQANAAVALLRMGRPEKVVPLLRHTPDPRVRSYLIHRLAELGANADAVARLLDGESDVTVRRALLLSLGGFEERDVAPAGREDLLRQVKAWYREDRDPGLHAAAEWLLPYRNIDFPMPGANHQSFRVARTILPGG